MQLILQSLVTAFFLLTAQNMLAADDMVLSIISVGKPFNAAESTATRNNHPQKQKRECVIGSYHYAKSFYRSGRNLYRRQILLDPTSKERKLAQELLPKVQFELSRQGKPGPVFVAALGSALGAAEVLPQPHLAEPTGQAIETKAIFRRFNGKPKSRQLQDGKQRLTKSQSNHHRSGRQNFTWNRGKH